MEKKFVSMVLAAFMLLVSLAFAEGTSIDVYNPLDEAVTRIEARCGEDSAAIDCSILHGEEKTLALPFAPTSLRAFTGEKEVCIYLHA